MSKKGENLSETRKSLESTSLTKNYSLIWSNVSDQTQYIITNYLILKIKR